MKIGIDLDGVVYDIITPFDKFIKEKGITPVETEYNRGLEKEVIRNYFQEMNKQNHFLWIPQFKYAVEGVNKLAEDNSIFIVTHRDWCENGRVDTLKRLEQDKIRFDYISFTKKKGEKAAHFGLDYFVEDSIVNARYIKEMSKADVFLIDRPYNKSEKEDRIYRVKDMREVVASIGSIGNYK